VRTLRAGLLGFVVALVVELTLAAALGLSVNGSGWGDVRLALGPLPFVTIEGGEGTVRMSVREGVFVIALIAGIANAVGARVLATSPKEAAQER